MRWECRINWRKISQWHLNSLIWSTDNLIFVNYVHSFRSHFEYLLYAKYCTRPWGYNNEQNTTSLLGKLTFCSGRQINKRIYDFQVLKSAMEKNKRGRELMEWVLLIEVRQREQHIKRPWGILSLAGVKRAKRQVMGNEVRQGFLCLRWRPWKSFLQSSVTIWLRL